MVKISDTYESGFILFAMPYETDTDRECAVEYCKENNLTPDDVRILIQTSKNSQNERFIVVKVK